MDGRRGVIDALMEESSLGTGSEAGCVPGLSCPGWCEFPSTGAKAAATPVAGRISKYERRMAGVCPGAKREGPPTA